MVKYKITILMKEEGDMRLFLKDKESFEGCKAELKRRMDIAEVFTITQEVNPSNVSDIVYEEQED